MTPPPDSSSSFGASKHPRQPDPCDTGGPKDPPKPVYMPVSKFKGLPPGFTREKHGGISILARKFDIREIPPAVLSPGAIRSLRPSGVITETICNAPPGQKGTMLKRTIFIYQACPCPKDVPCGPDGCCDISVPGPWEDTGEPCIGKEIVKGDADVDTESDDTEAEDGGNGTDGKGETTDQR